MTTPTLFDVPREWVRDESRRQAAARDATAWRAPRELDDIAFLYTGTESGNCSGIRFAMSIPDAQAWCSSDVSRGQLHGTRWAYFWTTAASFLTAFPPPLDLTGYVDSGEWDQRIAGLGLVKIGFAELPALLEPFGVRVVGLAGGAS